MVAAMILREGTEKSWKSVNHVRQAQVHETTGELPNPTG
jgi:hypothetical protein